MSELLDKLIAAIGSNCSNTFCIDLKCQYKGRVICKVEQDIARKCERIAIAWAKDHYNEKKVHY